MEIILSTRNQSKAVQIKAIFEGTAVRVSTLDEMGIEGEGVENGSTLEANALKKALFAHEKTGSWAMADDTGLYIKALGGEPGIKAARWAGENATTDEITAFTLKKLDGATDRSAIFATVVAVVNPDSEAYFFRGEVNGVLLRHSRVKAQPQMPYSPLFQPDGENLVWAQMSTEYENKISHRGIAFRLAKEFLEENM